MLLIFMHHKCLWGRLAQPNIQVYIRSGPHIHIRPCIALNRIKKKKIRIPFKYLCFVSKYPNQTKSVWGKYLNVGKGSGKIPFSTHRSSSSRVLIKAVRCRPNRHTTTERKYGRTEIGVLTNACGNHRQNIESEQQHENKNCPNNKRKNNQHFYINFEYYVLYE